MGADKRARDFERALLAMDRVGARETLLAAAEGSDTLAVAELVVAPALERIGDDWEHGTVSLAQLYMAGRIAEQIVGEVLPQVRPGPARPRRSPSPSSRTTMRSASALCSRRCAPQVTPSPTTATA